jgi:hypothetical protein
MPSNQDDQGVMQTAQLRLVRFLDVIECGNLLGVQSVECPAREREKNQAHDLFVAGVAGADRSATDRVTGADFQGT